MNIKGNGVRLQRLRVSHNWKVTLQLCLTMVQTPVHRRLNRHRRQYSQGMDPKSTCPPFSHARAQMQHVQRPQRIPPPQHVKHPQHVLLPESAQQQYDGVLGRMMSMLERVLARVELHSPEGRQKRPSCFSLPPCRVCGDANHSTLSHCRSDHLCFKCLAPGHSRQNCPNNALPQLSFGKLADLCQEGGNTGYKESFHSLDTDNFLSIDKHCVSEHSNCGWQWQLILRASEGGGQSDPWQVC